jgi:SAM-dependent methyltransferase
MAVASEQFDLVVGINTDSMELQGAYELLKEHHIANVLLVRASAQKLPFMPAQFQAVTCIQVLEHVRRPEEALHELAMSLAEGGVLFLSIPNRYTLRREPHTNLRCIGFLPHPLSRWYATMFNQIDTLNTVNLLSPGQVRAWLRKEFGDSFEFIRSGYHTSVLGKLAQSAWTIPVISYLAQNTVGDIEALAWR